MIQTTTAPEEVHQVDVCVVGGGMAGICAAIAAARGGSRVALIQDRPVLGGNASSEVRMWICGAHGAHNKETGILEELQLANLYFNPGLSYSQWDHVLYGAAYQQPGLDLHLNCAVCEVATEDSSITAVRAWHLVRQCWLRVEASLFIDCSGDSILRLSGASHRWGRESRDEFGESHAPAVADRRTMGNSILLQLREIDPADHRPFVPPPWAEHYDEATAPRRDLRPQGHNFWWLEVGGEDDTIADADAIRDRLLAIAYGCWAYIKNHPDGRGRGWELEWIGSLPGKRENVRYVGDHILTQGDIEAGGDFPDIVAYGGWTMDDHHPGGIDHPGDPTIFHPAPSPYGIPWRCLYSRDVDNLLFAGRNISCTHMALSSTRVMATCALLGQAVGTGAALALTLGCTPRQLGERYIGRLQHQLMDDDVYLPGRRRSPPALAQAAELTVAGAAAPELLDGVERDLDGGGHGCSIPEGGSVELRWSAAQELQRLRLITDSQLHRHKRMPCSWPRRGHQAALPGPLLRDLRVEVADEGGRWRLVTEVRDNHRRLLILPLGLRTQAVRIVCVRSWGGDGTGLFACEVGVPDLTAPVVRTGAIPALINRARATA